MRWILVPQQRAPGSHIIHGDKETQTEGPISQQWLSLEFIMCGHK